MIDSFESLATLKLLLSIFRLISTALLIRSPRHTQRFYWALLHELRLILVQPQVKTRVLMLNFMPLLGGRTAEGRERRRILLHRRVHPILTILLSLTKVGATPLRSLFNAQARFIVLIYDIDRIAVSCVSRLQ